MPLSAVCHPETGILEESLKTALDQRRGGDGLGPVWLVTPTRRLRQQLQRSLAARGSLLGVRFLDPLQLVRALEDACGLEPATTLPPLLSRLHLRAALADSAAGRSLVRFERAAAALHPSVLDLSEAGCEGGAAGEVRRRAARVALEAYDGWSRRTMEGGHADEAGLADRVTRHLLSAGAVALPPVFWFGFAELVARYRRLARALARHTSVQVLAFASGEKLVPALGSADAMARALAGEEAVRRLAGPLSPAPADGGARSVRGIRIEMEEALRTARTWFQEGTALEEMAVVVRSLAEYAPWLGPAAARAGLEGLLDSPVSVPLARFPVFQALLAACGPEADESRLGSAIESCDRERLARALREAWHDAQVAAERYPGHAFRDLLAEAGELKAVRPHERRDGGGLAVIDFQQARGLRFRRVVLAGFHQGQVPRPIAEDPFLPDDVRRVLSAGLGDPLPDCESQLQDEHALLDLALRTGTEQLVLLRQHADLEGSAVARSPLEEEIARRLGHPVAFEPLSGDPHAAAVARCETSATPQDAVLALAAGPGALEQVAAMAAERPAVRDVVGDGLVWLRAVDSFEPADLSFDGWVDPQGEDLAADMRVTRMERYGRAPLGYFFESVLRVDPRERELPVGPDPGELGTAIHQVLEQSWRAAEGSAPPLEDVLRRFDEIAGPLFAAGGAPHEPVLALERERWRRGVAAFLQWDVQRQSAASKDQKIGGGPWTVDPQALELELAGELALGEGAKLALRGKADRILRHGGAARVSDYKTGKLNGTSDGNSFLRGTRLQNALYLMLLEQDPERRGLEWSAEAVRVSPESDFSLTASQGGYGSGMPAPIWAAAREGIRESAAVLVRCLRKGWFPTRAQAWDGWFATMRISHEPTRSRIESRREWEDFFLLSKKETGRKRDGSSGVYLLADLRKGKRP